MKKKNPLPSYRLSPPIHPLDPPIPIRRDPLEQALANIDIELLARPARIHNCRLMMLLSVRVPDADLGAAARVGVGVGGAAHHLVGEGDDIVIVAGLVAAGTKPDAGAVVGHVAGVGEGGRKEGKEEKEEEERCERVGDGGHFAGGLSFEGAEMGGLYFGQCRWGFWDVQPWGERMERARVIKVTDLPRKTGREISGGVGLKECAVYRERQMAMIR